ncbi:MAG: sugar transferase [Desulfobacteraceae bacterium]|nr:sugar transferase [Desulfobacteraceae bacterium]
MSILFSRRLKRLLDILGAMAGLVFAAPVMAIIACLITVTMGRPVLFVQRRPGKSCLPFDIYKFRTMSGGHDGADKLLPDSRRLTALGRLLRALSLDELPELFNVLKGDMSLVGPRPLLMQYLGRYSDAQLRRHEVKPGLTGWAQVNGRNAIGWEEKFKLDVWYVDHLSLGLDLKIIALTVKQVLNRDGISHQGEATMPEFFPRTAEAHEMHAV